MFSLKELWRDIVYTRNLIIISVVLFSIAIMIGYTNESLSHFLDQQLQAIAQLAGIAEEANNKTLAFILLIFLNNAIKCVMVIFLGLFFGIYPLFFIVLNGLVIGYVLHLSASGALAFSLFDTIVKGLLPHGILEIPALIIAAAYGLRMGRLVWKTIFLAIEDTQLIKGIGRTYKGTMKRAAVMSIYLTLVLAIASIIESTVTVWLLSL